MEDGDRRLVAIALKSLGSAISTVSQIALCSDQSVLADAFELQADSAEEIAAAKKMLQESKSEHRRLMGEYARRMDTFLAAVLLFEGTPAAKVRERLQKRIKEREENMANTPLEEFGDVVGQLEKIFKKPT